MPSIKQHILLSLLIGTALVLSSCRTLPESDIPGIYTAQAEWGKATLLIRSDHSFEQTVEISKDRVVKKLAGNWSLDKGVFTMVPCLTVNHEDKGVHIDGCETSITDLGFGRAEIGADPDAGINYRK